MPSSEGPASAQQHCITVELMQLYALVCEPADNTHLNIKTGKPVCTILNGCVESAILLCMASNYAVR